MPPHYAPLSYLFSRMRPHQPLEKLKPPKKDGVNIEREVDIQTFHSEMARVIVRVHAAILLRIIV